MENENQEQVEQGPIVEEHIAPSEQENQQPNQQASPQAPPLMKAKCAKCGTDLFLQMPPLRVVNTPELSMLVFPHERVQGCQKCGIGYIPVVRGVVNGTIDIQFQTVEIQQKPMIVPPNPAQMQAVERSKSRGLVLP